MRRFFFRPIFDLYDPFHFHQLEMPIKKTIKYYQPQTDVKSQNQNKERDAHQLFEQFFNSHELKYDQERQFFKKHFPSKIQQTYDPYKVLEITKDASLQQVKDAYRKLALKYHPKHNLGSDAETKFKDVAKAYETIIENKNQRDNSQLGISSFFEEFDNRIKQAVNLAKEPSKSQNEGDYGELYSESSSYENINGKQTKGIIQKHYKKDGKLYSVKREEKLKEDGSIQITETIDNGKEVKKKTYIQEKDLKKIN